jgi:hypothetical protein
MGAAAVVMIGAAIASLGASAGTDAALAIVAIFNGIDLLIHSAAMIVGLVAGKDSGQYHLMQVLEVNADVAVGLLDLTVVAALTGGLGDLALGAAVAPLLSNTAALGLLGTFIGVDLVATINDVDELVHYEPVQEP